MTREEIQKEIADLQRQLRTTLFPPEEEVNIRVRLSERQAQLADLPAEQECQKEAQPVSNVNSTAVPSPDEAQQDLSPITPPLRSEPKSVPVKRAGIEFSLGPSWRPKVSQYLRNLYEERDDVVLDRRTGLMWQKDGSIGKFSFRAAQQHPGDLNTQQFAGYRDWRLPTIAELLSLLEKDEQKHELYINPCFTCVEPDYAIYWSADPILEEDGSESKEAWSVDFQNGTIFFDELQHNRYYVRAVRSWEEN